MTFAELPIVPSDQLRLDTGALVPADHGLGHWWEIDDFLETKTSWLPPPGSLPAPRRYWMPGPRGYCG